MNFADKIKNIHFSQIFLLTDNKIESSFSQKRNVRVKLVAGRKGMLKINPSMSTTYTYIILFGTGVECLFFSVVDVCWNVYNVTVVVFSRNILHLNSFYRKASAMEVPSNNLIIRVRNQYWNIRMLSRCFRVSRTINKISVD